ncbi:MAG: cell division protein FtsA [Cytophagales bacterium]
MESNKIITGIDIGSSKVKVTVGMPNPNGKLTILSIQEVVSEGMSNTGIVNVGKTVESIMTAVERASKEAGVSIASANVNIPGRHTTITSHTNCIIRENPEEEVVAKDMAKLHQTMYKTNAGAGHKILDIIPQAYFLDYEENIKDPIGMSGTELGGTFYVISAPNNVVNNIHKCMSKANISVDHLIFPALASSLSVLTEEEKKVGVCLLDLGASTTTLSIFQNNSLQHLALVPTGGDVLDKDIAHAFMLTEAQAEEIKTRLGSAYEDEGKNEIVVVPNLGNRSEKEIFLRIVDRIIEARIQESIGFVKREILGSKFQHKITAGIVITGGASQLKGLDKFLSYTTSYETRLGYPYGLLRGEESKLPGIEYATSIGLVLAGYKSIGQPEKIYKKKTELKFKIAPRAKKKSSGIWRIFRGIFD